MIRPLKRSDYDKWLPLWQENCLHQVSDDVTQETWRRLCHAGELVYGLALFDGEHETNLIGFLHYILHPTTGFIEPACYMQDLFIAPDFRRQGMAKRLIWELNEIGQREEWARIYWFAEQGNEAAQKLYKNIGISMNFSLHMLATHGSTRIN